MAMACFLRSTGITPASSLLRSSPPLAGASVLSASRLTPLAPFPLPSPARFSRSAREPSRGSRRLHAGCRSGGLMPSPSFSRRTGHPPVLTSPNPISTLLQRSLALASLDLAVLDLRSKFDCNAHHHGF